MGEALDWGLTGDWFDVCRCRVPCGRTFAQPADEGSATASSPRTYAEPCARGVVGARAVSLPWALLLRSGVEVRALVLL